MQKNLQVYIDAVGIDRDIIRAALRPSVKFLGFLGGVTLPKHETKR